ncbi:MAG: hypothetical protein Q8T11_18760 [Elusimicrobiota bacterium]|nr:hypothetical protein [Elusimicrobiota bacterium]
MKNLTAVIRSKRGAFSWGVLLLVAIPLPILSFVFLTRGCV